MAKTSVGSHANAAISKKHKNKRKHNQNGIKNTEHKHSIIPKVELTTSENEPVIPSEDKKVVQSLSTEQFAEKYTVFKDEELVKKFLSVTMTNNQKGRVRQIYRDRLKGTSQQLLPDIIYNHIQEVVKKSNVLTDAELRKIRILYNMLKNTVDQEKVISKPKNEKTRTNKKVGKENEHVAETNDKQVTKDVVEDIKIPRMKQAVANNEDAESGKIKKNTEKLKGPKRYVVFIGNLPLDVDKEEIMKHFSTLKDCIVNVRIPKQADGKKSSIAYVELKNEASYELALSKHHSMFNNKRINVLYSTQKNSKINITEAKGKSAKLVALQKSGKLMGSIPLNRKRSQRRLKAKMAKAKLEADA